MRDRLRCSLVLCSVLALTGCGSDSTSPDGGKRDSAPGDTRTSGEGMVAADGSAKSEIQNDFGFIMRIPQTRTIHCPPLGPPPDASTTQPVQQLDVDWICTFAEGEVSGHIYVQNTPTGCVGSGMSNNPTFTAGTAVISVGGAVVPLTEAQYEWGGNHHNDSLSFGYGGKYYRYFHSSLGYGGRSCQNMDCIKVYQSKTGTIVTDGCTASRTLPIVCLGVEQGKTYGEKDFTDTFKKCLGDPNP